MSQVVLTEMQNAAFDVEQVTDDYWSKLEFHVFPAAAPLRIADLGGGAGLLADRLLDRFQKATVDIVDISNHLLMRNRSHPRKRLIQKSLLEYEGDEKYDLIFINFVLHHMVGPSSRTTRDLVRSALTCARRNLASGGRLVVFEISPEGLFGDALSTLLLYLGTSSRIVAPIARALGANTAGVGVYYMGREEIRRLAADAGLTAEVAFEGGAHTEKTRYLGSVDEVPDP